MANFFKKAAIFTDIHFGLKSNSHQHNEDCTNFVKWFIEEAKKEGCETCIFTGDWHHNRASINIVTLNYSLNALELLSKAFERVIFIPGNHDLYYRDKRDIQSAEWAKHIPNIKVVNDFLIEDDVGVVPWMVEGEHKKIKKMNTKYVFGHFELPHFFMNAMIRMPENGEIKAEHFDQIGHVYSGHFHKRQVSENITYIGNAFPHNYADASDDARGMTILEWDKDPIFRSWPDQPIYRVFDLSTIIKAPEKTLKNGMHCRVNLDVDITYEEASFIRETFVDDYKLRELTLIPIKHHELGDDLALGNVSFESIDTIVSNQLTSLQEGKYDSGLLLDIYRHL
jgi:hypothetical protein